MRQFRFMRNVKSGAKNLLLHKLRSLLTMLGVVFGVGSVVVMLSVGEGASKEALEQIRKLGSNNIIINSMKAVEEEGQTDSRQMRMRVYELLYEDERRIQEAFPSVSLVVPVKIGRKEERLRDRVRELRGVATTPHWFELVQ